MLIAGEITANLRFNADVQKPDLFVQRNVQAFSQGVMDLGNVVGICYQIINDFLRSVSHYICRVLKGCCRVRHPHRNLRKTQHPPPKR